MKLNSFKMRSFKRRVEHLCGNQITWDIIILELMIQIPFINMDYIL